MPTSNPSEIAIIIPTVNRSGLLRHLLDNIHEATETSHQVYFVVESIDEPTLRETAELKSPHVSIIGAYGSYTRAANAGVRATKEPLILVANDDVVFHFGWDRAALERMQEPVLVVGIDQGNGRFDCFFLVDRRYITELSGVPDEANTFYHEGYISWYCDTEFADLAKWRGMWADANDSLIEHRHWTFGKAAVDVNYRKAIANARRDEALYSKRKKIFY